MSADEPAGEQIPAAQALAELRALLASDAHAVTFLTLGAYRTAMVRTIDEYLGGPPPGRAGA